MSKKHYNVVCAIIKKDDKILSVKRPDKGEVGLKWEFPGGKIEHGETMEEAIIREIKEELSCDIKVTKFLGTIFHEYESFDITLSGLLCEIVKGEIKLTEHIDMCWANKNELNTLDLSDADLILIQKFNPFNI